MSHLFQSTHPRGVRHSVIRDSQVRVDKFQSTHPRGVRLGLSRAHVDLVRSFNPRTRVGCDKILKLAKVASGEVSIHAPAWGATLHRRGQSGVLPSFNPRTRVGCDTPCSSQMFPRYPFQSTHPRGVRRRLQLRSARPSGFNPRTRVGCDTIVQAQPGWDTVFQSTHPRGVRR